MVAASSHAVAFTGAGHSVPSGVADFRTPGSGLWSQVDPMVVASIDAFRRDPQAFYDWLRPLARQMQAAQPNPAHLALAELERMGVIRSLLTQNIDGLHQRAGSQNVVELHGSARQATCTGCGRRMPGEEFWPMVQS